MSIELKGTGVALVTPFKTNGDVDFNALERIVNYIIGGKVEYLVMLGTTGETATLSAEEKKEVVQCITSATDKRIPLVLGVGGNNTSALLKHLEELDTTGLSAILSVSPYYNKPNQDGIMRHYTALAEVSALPLILYNVPGRTGSNMTAETTLRLAEHKNIVAIKEASGNLDQCMAILQQKQNSFQVISGDDAYTLPFISCGMSGVISVVANAYPLLYSEMVRLCLSGDYESARPLHYKILNTIKLMFADGSPGGVKAYLNLMGLCENTVRLPLAPVSANTYAEIKKDFVRLM